MRIPRQLRRGSVLFLLQPGRGKERKEIMIRTILWDVDGTLLDFHAAEGSALRSLFHEFGFGDLNGEDLARYKALNISLWKETRSQSPGCWWDALNGSLGTWGWIPPWRLNLTKGIRPLWEIPSYLWMTAMRS
jgi:hypothetical protein